MASVTPALRRTVRPSAKTSEQSRDRNEAVHWPRDMPGTTHLAAARGILVPMAVRAGVRWLDLAIIVTYVLGLTAIGLRFSRRQTTTDRYFTAKSSVPSWAVGMSFF